MARGFVAIRPPDAVLDVIEARTAAVPMPDGRRTTREQWHITLQFLGDYVGLAEVVSALGAEPFRLGGPGELRLGGADTFDAARRARILMLGLDGGAEWLGALATAVELRIGPLGYTRHADAPVFVPHLTLCRYQKPADLRPVCDAIGPDPVGPAWHVDEMVLVKASSAPTARGTRFALDSRSISVGILESNACSL